MILPHPVTLKLSEDIYVGNNDFFGRGEGMGWHNHLLMFCLTDFFQIYEFHFDSKRTRRAQHKHMNVHSPPPFSYSRPSYSPVTITRKRLFMHHNDQIQCMTASQTFSQFCALRQYCWQQHCTHS